MSFTSELDQCCQAEHDDETGSKNNWQRRSERLDSSLIGAHLHDDARAVKGQARACSLVNIGQFWSFG